MIIAKVRRQKLKNGPDSLLLTLPRKSFKVGDYVVVNLLKNAQALEDAVEVINGKTQE